MAKKFLTGLTLVNLTSDPETGEEGEIYFNSSTDQVRIYYNGSWNDLASEGGGEGAAETFNPFFLVGV
jgi:hypothetical protein